MNRRAFFRSLVLGGIVLPALPKKLILTGGWFGPAAMPRTLDEFTGVLTHEMLWRAHRLMITRDITYSVKDIDLIVTPRLRPEVEAMLEQIRKPKIDIS